MPSTNLFAKLKILYDKSTIFARKSKDNKDNRNIILSMTGYSKAVTTFGCKKIYAEIKSLNSKALDLSTRIAPLYREKEMEIVFHRNKRSS